MADAQHPCCAPRRQTSSEGPSPGPDAASRGAHGPEPIAPEGGLVGLPGGGFLMGSEDPGSYAEDGEGPVREVVLSPFELDRYAVSNDQFARFVDATAYRTDAEGFGSAFVFAGLLPDDPPDPGSRRRPVVARGPGRRLATP
jgi:formylglycine-generating enzyme required for sulfatase activity